MTRTKMRNRDNPFLAQKAAFPENRLHRIARNDAELILLV